MEAKSLNKNLNDTQRFIRNFRGSNHDKCFFFDCNFNSIKSHSISESKVLSFLEGIDDKNKKIIYHLENVPEVDFGEDKSISTYHQTHRKLYKKGKSDTSIFYGFCRDCDNLTFDEIDNNDYYNTNMTNFLHSIRTWSHNLTTTKNIFLLMKNKIISKFSSANEEIEYLKELPKSLLNFFKYIPNDKIVEWDEVSSMKDSLIETNTIPDKTLRNDTEHFLASTFAGILDKTNFPMRGDLFKSEISKLFGPLEQAIRLTENSSIKELNDILKIQLEEIDLKIKKITLLLRNKNYDYFNYLHRPINGIFPIAGAFVYRFTKDEDECIITFFPEQSTGKTHVIFAIPKLDNKYLSFLNIKSEGEFRIYLSSIIMTAGTNVFISPSFWNKLPAEIKTIFLIPKTDFKEHSINLFEANFLSKLY